MAQRAMIFLAILTAAVVAFAIVIVTGGGPAITVGAPLIDRAVFTATAVEIAPPGVATPLRLEREGERWVVASDSWPANEAAVRGALRLLGEVAVVSGRAVASEGETRVTIEFEGDEQSEVWVEPSSRAVGGGAAIRDALGRQGRVPIDLARAFEGATVDAWRSPAALPHVDIESSRVTIRRSDGPTSLARVDGRWFLREPVRAKADDRAVAALLGDLIDLRATRFGGEAIAEPGPGVLGVEVERDVRVPAADGTVAVETRRSALRVLGPANAESTEMVVESDGVRLVVRSDRLAALGVEPVEFVARGATTATPGDVGMIVLRRPEGGPGSGELAFRRRVLAWDALGDAAARLADPAEESGGVERVLSFLAHAQAESVRFAQDDRESTRGYIQLFNLSDEPLATIRVHRGADGALSLVDDAHPGVVRVYGAAQVPPLLRAWLDGLPG